MSEKSNATIQLWDVAYKMDSRLAIKKEIKADSLQAAKETVNSMFKNHRGYGGAVTAIKL